MTRTVHKRFAVGLLREALASAGTLYLDYRIASRTDDQLPRYYPCLRSDARKPQRGGAARMAANPRPTIIGRSSSHFTRVTRIFAAEMSVDYSFDVVRDLISIPRADVNQDGAHGTPRD